MDQDSIDPRPAPSPLRRQLSGAGVLLLALSSLSPVLSAYGIGSDVLLHAGSGAAVLFLLGIGVALVFGVVYAELGSAYPYAGGDYVGVGTILGANYVNIAEYRLGRTKPGDLALSFVNLDNPVPEYTIKALKDLPEVVWVKQMML